MTEPDIDVTIAPEVSEMAGGPGHRLRRARERQGLDVVEVADRLHLPERLVIAIENDDFSALPGAVFAQGYLRNYARQVGEPADEIVEMFHEARPREEYKPALHQFQLPMKASQVNSSHGLIKTVTWLIVLALLILLVVWWRGYIKLPVPILGEEEDPASVGGNSSGSAIPLAPAPSPQPSALEIPAPVDSGVTAPDQGPAEPGASAMEGTSTPSLAVVHRDLASDEIVSGEVGGEMPARAGPEGGDRKSAIAESPGPNEVRLVFEAPCWVDIRDSKGEKVLYGGIGAGDTFTLSGVPPYQVLLGNSSAVKITVGGEDFATDGFAKGRVARFVLDPATAMTTAGSSEQ